MQLNRKEIIQRLVDQKGFTNYLEIGVFLGNVFFDVRAKHKTGVDPNVKWGLFKLIKRSFRYKNRTNLWSRSVKMTSDEFFAKKAAKLYADNKLDICLVDGMHAYDFALRDVENCLNWLQKNGVIIMHDCNPKSRAANVSFEEWEERGFTGDWNGDVWKAIVHLRSLRADINVFVLDCDQGLGIVSFGKPESNLKFSADQIRSLSYEDLAANRKEWLNLKDPSYFFEYFNIR